MSPQEFHNPTSVIRERMGKVRKPVAEKIRGVLSSWEGDFFKVSTDASARLSIEDYYKDKLGTLDTSSALLTSLYVLATIVPGLREISTSMSEYGNNQISAILMDYEKGAALALAPIVHGTCGAELVEKAQGVEHAMVGVQLKEFDIDENRRLLENDSTGMLLLRRQIQRVRTSRVGADQYIKSYEDQDTVFQGIDFALRLYKELYPIVEEVVSK